MKARTVTFAFASLALISGLCACDKEEKDDGHGLVRVNMQWSDAQDSDPFVGTQFVEWQVDYDRTSRCLLNFYLGTDTSYQANGTEGQPIFADWEESSYVCDKSYNKGTTDCEVVPGSLDQFFSDSDPMESSLRGNLRQDLEILDDDLTGRELAIGPIPNRDLLPSSCAPKVTFGDSALKGFDGAGNQLWRISGTKDATMITDQGAPALAEAVRL